MFQSPVRFCVFLLALLSFGTSLLAAQAPSSPGAISHGQRREAIGTIPRFSAFQGTYVIVSLAEFRLYLLQDDRILWSAPIAIGSGATLQGKDKSWDFSTPSGVFEIQFKEKDPVWIADDWYFVKNNLPVPPPGDPSRFFPGDMGAAALYLQLDLAIHGTDKPELLGQAVSHGCIRMSNEDVMRLYHEVKVGTQVLIF